MEFSATSVSAVVVVDVMNGSVDVGLGLYSVNRSLRAM